MHVETQEYPVVFIQLKADLHALDASWWSCH